MKKILIYLSVLFLTSCGQSITKEEKERLKIEIQNLNQSQSTSTSQLNTINSQLHSQLVYLQQVQDQILQKKTELQILQSGRVPRYILKLHFQEHKFELSMDRIEFDFEIPVDEKFYNESTSGSELGSGSRFMSFSHTGDITIVSKRIE